MQTYSQTTAGAQDWVLDVPGKYFALLACNNAVTVKFFKGGRPLDLGEISGVMSGLECTLGEIADAEPAFDRVKITTTGADTVQVGIGNGQSRYNRAGNATVNIANTGGAFSQSTATVTSASASLIAASPTRRYILIQNKDAVGNIYLNVAGAAATIAGGIRIPPGGNYELSEYCCTSQIFAIGDIASNGNVIVVTG